MLALSHGRVVPVGEKLFLNKQANFADGQSRASKK